MFLRPVIKIFSRVFHRKHAIKRHRNPSTFQECTDSARHPRVSWKPVLVILLLLPTIYYMFYFRRYGNSSLEFNDSGESTTESDLMIRKKKSTKIKDIQIVRPRKPFVEVGGLPLCATVTVNAAENETDIIKVDNLYLSTNTSDGKIAQDYDIHMGGHFVPKDCRPRHKVAILVPYWWNRKNSLKIFLYYIHPFLVRQRLEYRIFVIEQHGNKAINRGRLFNAGFLEVQKNDNWQCVILHDVDLLPADNRIRYTCPVLPRHMCAAVVGKENVSRYSTVFGGVTAMTMWHFKKANGFSNLYTGRGESEDMFKRLQAAGLGVTRYKKDVGKYVSLKHTYGPDNPRRVHLLMSAKARYKDDGLSNLIYNVAGYSSHTLFTHIIFNVDNKKQPDYITERSITLSP